MVANKLNYLIQYIGGPRMKRFFTAMLAMVLFLAIGTSALAEENYDYEKGYQIIEKANGQIDRKINQAVEKADKLQEDYLLELRRIEEGKEVVKIQEELKKAREELSQAAEEGKDTKSHMDKISQLESSLAVQETRINEKIGELEQDIATFNESLESGHSQDGEKLNGKIEKLKKQLLSKTEKAEAKTERYLEELDKIIEKVFNETLEMSEKAIAKAAEYGVLGECSWRLVQFAHQEVWIDPIRIIGTR